LDIAMSFSQGDHKAAAGRRLFVHDYFRGVPFARRFQVELKTAMKARVDKDHRKQVWRAMMRAYLTITQ
jgi:hypothetical protein